MFNLPLKVCHPLCVRPITQRCSVYIYIYIHTVMNTIILQLVAIYNIQLHVSTLYVGHHQVVQRTLLSDYTVCVVIYITLLIVILLYSWLYECIYIYAHYSFVLCLNCLMVLIFRSLQHSPST